MKNIKYNNFRFYSHPHPYNQKYLNKNYQIETIKNHIYFYAPITTKTCLELNKQIIKLSFKLQKKSFNSGTGNGMGMGISASLPYIYIHINSLGGSVHDAFAVVDTIKKNNVKVITIVEGYVASAATLISLAGFKRYITDNSFMRIHQISIDIDGRIDDIKCELDNTKLLMEKMINLYLEKSKLRKNRLEDILRQEMDLDSKKCIEYGFADEIWNGNYL